MYKKLCTLLIACGVMSSAFAMPPPDADHDGNPMLYGRHSRPFDKSIYGWADRSIQWLYAQPFDKNPFFDQTGANCGVGQDGPVWYLAPIASPMMSGSLTRSCTIPRDKAILLMVGFVSDTYPCPDPNFGPAPGQSLYDFLVADSKKYMMMMSLNVTLDGRPIHDALDYQYISENVFSVKGDPSLQSSFDSCITTSWQPDLNNGYYMLFRPLSPGQHTIVRTSTGMMGGTGMMTMTYTYYLTIK
ncbi:hypothetical protein SAMN05216570_3826 [Dyella sp. OK004]|uniref:hypothetical protein n=1 Tax=Dyella sp. OK004 TaxID=1855292 RepID=UPI0008DF795B|nr:hypothetical protein [Dyella sp. OK004]SFS18826.1 hypothetical protein SAMN05216570_3826 [Dyella sp. OK004]